MKIIKKIYFTVNGDTFFVRSIFCSKYMRPRDILRKADFIPVERYKIYDKDEEVHCDPKKRIKVVNGKNFLALLIGPTSVLM